MTTGGLSKESEGNSSKLITYLSVLRIFFYVWNVIFSVSEKLLTELHLDIACIAGSKQHIGNPNSEATRCTGIV